MVCVLSVMISKSCLMKKLGSLLFSLLISKQDKLSRNRYLVVNLLHLSSLRAIITISLRFVRLIYTSILSSNTGLLWIMVKNVVCWVTFNSWGLLWTVGCIWNSSSGVNLLWKISWALFSGRSLVFCLNFEKCILVAALDFLHRTRSWIWYAWYCSWRSDHLQTNVFRIKISQNKYLVSKIFVMILFLLIDRIGLGYTVAALRRFVTNLQLILALLLALVIGLIFFKSWTLTGCQIFLQSYIYLAWWWKSPINFYIKFISVLTFVTRSINVSQVGLLYIALSGRTLWFYT